MNIFTLFLFVWGFGISIYLIIIGLYRLISESMNSNLEKLDRDIKKLELSIKQIQK